MVIYTKKRSSNRACNSAFKTTFFFTFSLLCSIITNAQQVNGIITDFNGYWRSDSAALNATFPNTSHNVVAFKIGSTIYSTGINNSLLASKNITYTAGNFKALPITSITGTITSGAPIYIALAGNYDGNPTGYSNPLPTVKMKDVLTDGTNGLDIGTGTTNIPATATMTFPVQSVDVNSISDAKPDILYTQIASPSTTGNKDILYFANSSGTMIGNTVSVNWGSVPSLGTYILDLYSLQVGATCDNAVITSGASGYSPNDTRNIRLTAFKLSDFGITSTNKANIASLIIKPGGESDPAFVAYNSDAFVILPPSITTQPQTQVVCSGASQSATFSVAATGVNDTYQWKKNGVDIVGATGSSYTISPVTANDAGGYQVVVTNGGGTVTSNTAYLNTAITRQPSPSAQTVVTGNTVTLSVSATNATGFQWKKNGVDIVGATDSIYTINTLNITDSGSYTVSAINTASGGCASVVSNAAVITPVVIMYSTATGNLNVPGTWGANTDGSGSTPVNFTRAEHTFVLSNRASGSTLTDLTIAGTLDVKNGIAIIADNTTLDVGRCIRTGSGSVSGSSLASLTVRGNSDLFFTATSQVLKNFTIAGGTVNMLSPLAISGGTLPGKLNLTAGTLALGTNKITISSTSATNTSMITAVGSAASVTYGTGGAFVIERYIPAKRSFRFISPSVTTITSIKNNWMEGVVNPDRWNNINPNPGYGTHITGPRTAADSLDVTQTYNPSLFTFDNNLQSWNAVANSAGTLTAGSAYRFMIRGSRSVDLNNNDATPSNTIIRATGKITIGNYSSTNLSTRVGGYSFIGNPYACPVDWMSLTKSGLSNSYYVWDETLNNRGGYVAYNGNSQTNSNSISKVDQNIQSGQAFFVQNTSTSPSILFKETSKSYTNTSVFREASVMTKLAVQLLLNLDGGSNSAADGFTEVFSDNFIRSAGDQNSFKFTNLDENIGINRNGTILSIEGRPDIISADTIPIKMWQLRQKDYFFKIDASNFATSLNAKLKDNYLNRETPIDLASSTVIPFSVSEDSASFAPQRFSIVFKAYSTLPVVLSNVKAYQKSKDIAVEWNTATEINIEQYEVEKSINGKDFSKLFAIAARSDNAGNHSYQCLDENANGGDNFYRIKTVEKNGTIKYSEIVRVNIPDTKSGITIYPNPAQGNEISLQLSGIPEGEYSLIIYNSLGQSLYKSTIKHKGRFALKNIDFTRKIAPGKYTLQLSNDKNKFVEALLIQ